MPQDPHKALRLIADHMIRRGMGDYLVSVKFSRFCREHDIAEIWGGLLGSTDGKPELYGSDVIRDAFLLLLEHIYRGRRAELPGIIASILADYAKKMPDPSFIPAIKQDLILLGYSMDDVEDSFKTMCG
jgi:hypothetical protein